MSILRGYEREPGLVVSFEDIPIRVSDFVPFSGGDMVTLLLKSAQNQRYQQNLLRSEVGKGPVFLSELLSWASGFYLKRRL
jgi:hypothetical protein